MMSMMDESDEVYLLALFEIRTDHSRIHDPVFRMSCKSDVFHRISISFADKEYMRISWWFAFSFKAREA